MILISAMMIMIINNDTDNDKYNDDGNIKQTNNDHDKCTDINYYDDFYYCRSIQRRLVGGTNRTYTPCFRYLQMSLYFLYT